MIEPELLAGLLGNPVQLQERLNALIAERSATDERFGTLAQMMFNQAPPSEPQSSQVPRRRIALERLRSRVSEMREDFAVVLKRNRLLASALGACSQCLGADPECNACKGLGAAGWLAPDPSLFQQFVTPAIARLSREIDFQLPEKGMEP